MDNQELLNQVADLFKQQNEVFSEKFNRLENEIKQVRFEVEVNVSKRIEALFDGYKLTHEKQWEQERKIEVLQAQMEELQLRLSSLENKSA